MRHHVWAALLVGALILAGFDASAITRAGPTADSTVPPPDAENEDAGSPDAGSPDAESQDAGSQDAGPGTITLAFAGDVHFAGPLGGVAGRDTSTLGPMSSVLRQADVAVVNLETALTRADSDAAPASKELEDADNRYWFRSPPAALDVLERSGVDAVSVANNHGADYGVAGLRDTLRIAERSPVAVLGVGADDAQAFEPYRVTVRGTDVAVLAADASERESADATWSVRPGSGPGLASARGAQATQLTAAVRAAAETDDLVVVYLHWGEEGDSCPSGSQESLARALSEAGADVIVGSHTHVPLGSGLLSAEGSGESAYVSYGLGNFFWYHGITSETGVLQLRVRGDQVVDDEWVPGEIRPDGGNPQSLSGGAAREAVASWRGLRACTDLAPGPGAASDRAEPAPAPGELPAYVADVRRIGPALRARMTSHDGASCPVALADLRHLSMSYVGFDGRAHTGEMVVADEVADDVADLFGSLYAARFPIRRMRLIDAYDGDDDRSMAANNTSGYNCRRVAGSSGWSDHAYGRAVDINPVANPYVVGGDVRPPAGRAYVSIDRGAGAEAQPGVITANGVVTQAFDRIGWEWGGDFVEPDYQHFSLP